MVLQCEQCMVTVSSEEAMELHVKGKKHLRNTQDRFKQASHTVFTRGFNTSTTNSDIQEYFQKYGKIENVFLETRHNPFAMVEFKEESSVATALAEAEHEMNGSKLSVMPRRVKTKLTRMQLIKRSKTRRLAESTAAEQVSKELDKEIHVQLTDKLQNITSLNEQMRILYDTVQMTDKEVVQKKEICDSLLLALGKFFPGCTIHQFGSSVNGFGVKGCDADIYLDFHEEEGVIETEENNVKPDNVEPVVKTEGMEVDKSTEEDQDDEMKLPFHRDISSLTKTHGPLTSSDLNKMTIHEKVRLVSRLIVEYVPGCKNTLLIPSNRCPLIRFHHESTGIRCDMSVSNRLALQNTRLLSMCSHMDERVRLLVYTVRYWAKMRDLSGGSGQRLSNYALTFLVLQYLQTLASPILPTVNKLAELAGRERVVIDGWDCSYLDQISTLPATTNKDSVVVLLKGFFDYYSKLDFSSVVIQTRTGTLLPVGEMAETSFGENKKRFRIGAISIQDPFVLDHNISSYVNEATKEALALELLIAAKKTSKWTLKYEAGQGLLQLVDGEIPCELDETIKLLKTMEDDFNVGNTMSFIMRGSHLPRAAFDDQKTPDFRLNWCFKVCTFIHHIFETVMMFETDIVEQTITGEMPSEHAETRSLKGGNDEATRKRVSTRGDVAGQKKSRQEPIVQSGKGNAYSKGNGNTIPVVFGKSPSLHMELLCRSCCPVWNGRRPLRKEVQLDGEELRGLELEREISEYIIENIGHSQQYLLQFSCHLDTIVDTTKTAVKMTFTPIECGREFLAFFLFFKTFFRKLMEKNLYGEW